MEKAENTLPPVKVEIVDYKGGYFKADDGRQVTYSKAIISFGGREIKVHSDVDLSDNVGEVLEVLLSLTPGKEQMPKLSIAEVVGSTE